MREKLYVFDNQDNLLTVTYNYITAEFEETVEKPEGLTIEFPMLDEDAEHFVGGNQVAFRDLKGNFRLFVIREVDDQGGEATEKVIECLPAMQELTDVMVEEKRPQDRTAEYVLDIILEKSRWQVGHVADLGKFSTSFYFKDAYKCLEELTDIWGGEVVDRIEIDKNKISGRYIDIVTSKGENNGKRFEIGKDIKNITRTVLYYPKTALYGKGSSLEEENDEGETSHSRKITFRDIVWKKSDGDPVDKPKGQEWVGDPEAIKKHGIPNHKTGELNHRFGMFEDNDEEDPETLLKKTWEAVQDEKDPKAQYEMDIETFYGVADYEHEQVFLGDTGIARDKSIKPMILVESRVMSLKYDIGNPENGEVTLGNILDLSDSNTDIDWVIDKVKDNAGNSGGGPITDEKFPDIKPPVPENVKVDGLYQTIMLSWDFDSAFYIASYEVYASQTKGFVPDSTNLVFRGKTGGYNHEGENNDKWYFRIRAVNTHGTASEYTDEYSASTTKINFDDIDEENIPDFIELSIYKGDTAPSPDDYKYWIDTGNEPELLYFWNEDAEDWKPLAPTNAKDLGAVEIEEYQNKIYELTSDIADKVDAEWVNGQLVSKVDKETYEERMEEVSKDLEGKADANKTYTIEDIDDKIDNTVSKKEYKTDKDANIERFKSNETSIEQNEKDIKSKASQEELDSTNQSVKDNSSEISQNAKKIESKVEQKEFSDLSDDVSKHETRITQTEKDINSKVDATEYKEDKDGIVSDIKSNTSEINQNAKEISSKVDETYVKGAIDDVVIDGRNIIPNSNEFEETVRTGVTATFDTIEVLEWNAQDATRIKANGGNEYRKLTRNIMGTTGVEGVWSVWVKNMGDDDIKISFNGWNRLEGNSSVSDITIKAKESKRVVVPGKARTNHDFIQISYSVIGDVNKKLDIVLWHEQLEKGNKVTGWYPAPEDAQAQIDDTNEVVKNNTSEITQNAEAIKSKVDETTYKSDKDGITKDIKDNKSEIEQNAKAITSKVEQKDIDGAIEGIDPGGRNYFVIKDAKEDTLLVWASGKESGEKGALASGYIPVEEGAQYSVSPKRTSQLFYYDKNKQHIEKPNLQGGSLITIPKDEGIAYIRVTFRKNFLDGRSKEEAKVMLEKGNMATDWTPALEDTEAEIKSVRDYASSIEQTAKGIRSSVTSLEKEVSGNKTAISDAKSDIKQQADQIASRVTKTSHKADMDKLNIKVSEAESSIKQNADSITSKVSKNGVISSIRQSPETVKIDVDRVNIDGDLNVVNGMVRIQKGIITNELIAGNAKIDSAKIGNISASQINAGEVTGLILRSQNLGGRFEVSGSDATFINSSGTLKMMPDGLYFYNTSNNLRYQLDTTLVSSSALGTSNHNVYLGAKPAGEARVVDYRDIPSDGLIGSYRYLPLRASGFYGNFWNINPAIPASNLYARPLSDGELRITLNGTTDIYQPVRAEGVKANFFEVNSLSGSSDHLYIRARTNGEIRATVSGTTSNYVAYRGSGFYGNFIDKGTDAGVHLYARPAGSPGELRVTVRGTTGTYRPARARDFITDTSLPEKKKDIKVYDVNTLDTWRRANIYTYHRLDDGADDKLQLGAMLPELPEVTHGESGDSFALYAYSSYIGKGVKDLVERTDEQEEIISRLARENKSQGDRIAQLEKMMHEFMGGNK